MRVIFQTAIAGNDYAYRRGQEVDLPTKKARAFIKGKIAKPAKKAGKKKAEKDRG